MKIKFLFLLDLGLFLFFFCISGVILYRVVYSELENYSSGGLVLISEVRPSGGSGKTNDEFIELYNPGIDPVIIGGWKLSKLTKSASSTDLQLLFTFPSGVVLPSHSHILVAQADYVGSVLADYLYSGLVLSDDNTVILSNETQVIDMVGYGLAKNFENQAAEAPSAQLLSLERRPGANLGNRQDTNNNLVDFFRAGSSPQNLASTALPILESLPVIESTSTIFFASTTSEVPEVPIEITTSVAESFPSSTISTTTLVQSVMETTTTVPSVHYLSGSVLINELYPAPESGQSEFVELFNPTPQIIDLTDWYLTDGSGAKTALSGSLNSATYLVIEKPKGSLNNSGDLVKLLAPNETVIDQVAYGDWNDGEPGNNAPMAEAGLSVVRIYESQDSNFDYFDFGLSTTVTKGVKNVFTPVLIALNTEENEPEDEEENLATSATVTSTTKVVAKKPEPLYPRIAYSAAVLVGDEVRLDAAATTGGQGLKQYIWEMDDGVILRGETIAHVYKEPDTFSVVLTAFDDTGVEKRKTVKIKVLENPTRKPVETEKNKQVSAATVKTSSVKKAEPVAVYTPISELLNTKNSALIRVRGVLAAVLMNKTVAEFYFVGESSAGGAAVGVLVKTKSTTLDARVGDLVELTGKYILNGTAGNYLQFGTTDKISIVRNGEIVTPLNSNVKDIKQLSGGYVQVNGEVVEKKNGYVVISDETGEIKINGGFEEMKIGALVTATGYIMRVKEGVVLRTANVNDIFEKKVTTTTKVEPVQAKGVRPINTFIVIEIIILIIIGLGIKKFLPRQKTELNEATEI